jgi:hypothetical protein
VISRFVGLAKLFAIPPEKGAETIIYLASSAAVTEMAGVYFYKCQAIALGAQRRFGGPEGPLNLRAERLRVLVEFGATYQLLPG